MRALLLILLLVPATAFADDPHGGLTADLDCSSCHTTDGWGLSGGAASSGFDHDRTGFPLRGAHETTQCTGCHQGKMQVATACAGCHRDPHEGRMDGACEECHRTTDWNDTSALEAHRLTRMPLTGAHATLDCTACHTRGTERTWSDTPTDCYACHAKDYHSDTIHPSHQGDASNAPFSRECATCHTTAAWSPAVIVPAASVAASTIDHDAWFELSTGSHADAACEDCHTDASRMTRVRCDGCHAGADLRADHLGRRVARSASSCLRCHPQGAAR